MEAYIFERPDCIHCRFLGGCAMLRVIICDDDIEMVVKIRDEVEHIFMTKEIKAKIHCFTDAKQISDQMLSNCDIILLDIDFEDLDYNGMDVARRLRKFRKDALIIFVTNFIEYAPEGYEVQAFRYVLKREVNHDLQEYLLQAIKQLKTLRQTFKIQLTGEIIDLPLDNILYFEVQQHNVTACVQRDSSGKKLKTYSFSASLSDLEQKLASQGFLRIHKSYLVNMRHLKKLQCRDALLDNGSVLRASEKSYAANKRKYLQWKGWE